MEATGGGGDEGTPDETVAYRVGGPLPVIVWDSEADTRRVVPMRWGFPDSKDWRRPRPIHARADTVDERQAFRSPFLDGQRGIVIFRTFNEGEEAQTSTGRLVTKQ